GAVADAVVAEQVAEDRIEPGLRQLVVAARVDLLDVGALHQRPQVHVQQLVVGKLLAQPIGGFLGLLFVQGDTRRRSLLDLLPLRLFEAFARAVGDQLELLTIIVEALEDGAGNLGRPLLHHVGFLLTVEPRAYVSRQVAGSRSRRSAAWCRPHVAAGTGRTAAGAPRAAARRPGGSVPARAARPPGRARSPAAAGSGPDAPGPGAWRR